MGNRIFLGNIFAVAAYLFYDTFFFKKNMIARTSSPEGIPRIVLAGIMLIALMIFLRDYKNDLPSHVASLFQGTRLYVVVALPIYLLTLPWLGFSVSTFFLLTLLFTILTPERPTPKGVIVNALLAACLTMFTFILFRHVFHIQLPVNFLGL